MRQDGPDKLDPAANIMHGSVDRTPDRDYIDEFPLDPGLIYLNHAAVSPWPRRTAVAVQRFEGGNFSRRLCWEGASLRTGAR